MVGFVQATLSRSGAELLAEVAWLIIPAAQGAGLATEAAGAAIAWLEANGAGTIAAHISPQNAGSESVARRLGLSPTEVERDGEIRWTS